MIEATDKTMQTKWDSQKQSQKLLCNFIEIAPQMQKFNLSPTLVFNHTKATRRRVRLVSCPV